MVAGEKNRERDKEFTWQLKQDIGFIFGQGLRVARAMAGKLSRARTCQAEGKR
jgi:hypothetical protein